MFFIALDQSLANTGFCIAELNSSVLTFPDYGVVKTPPNIPEIQRLASIELAVLNLIKKYKPTLIYTEEVFLSKQSVSFGRVLIKVETTLHNMFYKENVNYKVISAGNKSDSWRKILDCNKKREGKKATSNRLKINDKIVEHTADSIAIMLTGLYIDKYINKESINEYWESYRE